MDSSRQHSQYLGQLNIEIKFLQQAPRRSKLAQWYRPRALTEIVTDDAFQPKSFTIKIQKGNFMEPGHLIRPTTTSSLEPWVSRYEFHLTIDKTPFPPLSEWKDNKWGVDFWNHKEFVGRESKDLRKEGRAMNDKGDWDVCTVS